MTNLKLTKRALISSVMALFVCFAMLLGTTFAWFTDSAVSSGNIIQTGTLDVTLESKSLNGSWADASEGPIFNYNKWEPGYTDVKYVRVGNNGTLALDFVLTVVPNQAPAEVDLAEVIDVYMFDGEISVDRSTLATATPVGTVADLIANVDGTASGTLASQETMVYTIVLKMQETAGNKYQGLSLGGGFSVNVLATQASAETDAFGPEYDEEAVLPAVGSGAGSVEDADVLGKVTVKVQNANSTNTTTLDNVATLVFPKSAINETVQVTVKEDVPQEQSVLGINVEGDVQTYDITVTGLVANNQDDVEVYLYVGAGKNVGNIVYHTLANGTIEEIPCTYDSNTGNVRFKTDSFSPFSVVVYDEPLPVDPELPVADVEEITEPAEGYEWMGEGSQIDGIVELVNPGSLDVYYQFAAQHTPEEASANKYAEWKCDYFVKVNKTIGEKSIVLGGSYGGANIAFTNLTEVEGETWIPLLLTVSKNGWTYQDIVAGVGTFVCGVADVDGKLAAEGVTFTVQLRLVDPEANDFVNPAEGEYIVATEVVYDFATQTSTVTK